MAAKHRRQPPARTGGIRFSWVVAGVLVACAVAAGAWRLTHPPTNAEAAAAPTEEAATARPATAGAPALREAAEGSAAELRAQLLNAGLDARNRRRAARALARLNTDEALAALRAAFQQGPAALQAAIAECLGESTHPQARAMLLELIDQEDETVACGAIRGFALRGDAEAVDILNNLLLNEKKSEAVRTEAALALGEVAQPGALAALTRAATEIHDDAITEQVMEGLAKRPFAETQAFFRSYLETPGLSTTARVTAVEALSNAEGEVAPFLLKYVADASPEVRAAAAWALSSAEPQPDLPAKLLDLARKENTPEVRSRLYQALGGQETFDGPAILALAQNEADPSARLAGFDLVANACRGGGGADLANFFNQTALPELKRTALESGNLPDRLASVITLGRAPTPEASAALAEIARQVTDRQVAAAAQAALRIAPRQP